MSDGYHNPFPPGDADRHELWHMLVERDTEAFIARDWSRIEDDFITSGFLGIGACGLDNPDSWQIAFPTLAAYRDAWLAQADHYARLIDLDKLRQALIDITTLRDIEVCGDFALAHKKFAGRLNDTSVQWQTLYRCTRIGNRWKIAGFLGYLPFPMGTSPVGAPAKRLPKGADQHTGAGPYSPVLVVTPKELVVISGQAAIAADGRVPAHSIEEQTTLTLENCRRQLNAADCDFADVFKVNVYLVDLAYWPVFNEIYRNTMPDPKPVRTAVQAALLPDLLVEVEMWAVRV